VPFFCKLGFSLFEVNSDFCRVQTIKRREYGGGLHKFEPRDLEKIPTLDITKLNRPAVKKLASFFDSLSSEFSGKDKDTEIRQKLDALIQKLVSSTEIKKLAK